MLLKSWVVVEERSDFFLVRKIVFAPALMVLIFYSFLEKEASGGGG